MVFVAMPRQDLLVAVDALAAEKNIERDVVFESLEAAIKKIAKTKYGEGLDIDVKIDRKNGAIHIKRLFQVIDPKMVGVVIEADEFGKGGFEYNEQTMLTPEQAKKYVANAQIGDVVEDPLPEPEFGRMAFQQAKQIMSSRVRDAERGHQFEEFKDSIGDIVHGTVKRIEFGNVFVDIQGKAEGYVRRNELIPRERMQPGDRVRALVLDVTRTNSGPQIFLTRTHPLFMEKLFMQEVPEIYEGIIKIKSVARAPGSHAKVAVWTDDPSVDPVGMTVGMKGTRIQPVINECQGEKIDVVLFSEDPAVYVVNAIAPAKVAKIILDEDTHTAQVVVNEDQQSLAIGRRGQNVRLAAQLTGWNIDILSEAEEQERRQRETKEKSALFMKGLDVDEMIAQLLIAEGFRSVEEVAFVPLHELETIDGFDADIAAELQQRAKDFLAREEKEFSDAAGALKMADDLLNFKLLKRPTLLKLGHAGIRTLCDFADLATDELVEILGEDEITEVMAGRLIMKARKECYGTEEVIEDAE